MRRLWFESYLKYIENSVGTDLFRNFYIEEDERERDVLNDGELSCAMFVSSILTLFAQNKTPHATVSSTQNDLIKHGWVEVKFNSEQDLQEGDIIIWEPVEFTEEPGFLHAHIGFYLGGGFAVSNNYKTGKPDSQKLDPASRKISSVLRGKVQFEKLPQPTQS